MRAAIRQPVKEADRRLIGPRGDRSRNRQDFTNSCLGEFPEAEGSDQPTEVERLVALGATAIDIGQGDVPWVVLADPDGNEFCVWPSAASVGRH